MRKILDLNFSWKFSETFSEEMIRPGFDDSSFEKVDIPHTNKELPYNYFDEASFQFVSCYRKIFRVPQEAFEGKKHIFISFEGAANYSKVYLNGEFIAYSFYITYIFNASRYQTANVTKRVYQGVALFLTNSVNFG